jgi:hypothetical protein
VVEPDAADNLAGTVCVPVARRPRSNPDAQVSLDDFVDLIGRNF